jgi:penicillin-binding protein 2
LALVCLGVFAALFARLWYLQVLNAPTYEHVATLTATRTVTIPAPRGRILDRTGKVLVDNVPTKVVAIDRQRLDDAPNRDAVISRVATLLNHFEKPKTPFSAEAIKRDLAVNQVGPFDPVPLAENVSDELLVELIEHRADYPGVVAETRLLRQYHYGSLAAQVLGRVGPIPESMWRAHEGDPKPYPKDAQVGLSGVEQAFETQLRGVDGERVVEVTPAGRVVRTVKTVSPKPGNDVELTLDIAAQATTEAALAAQVKVARNTCTPQKGCPPVPGAAALLLDPTTGQVLSMASYPTYDPSIFVPAISERDWKALQATAAHAPLTNRADGGLYSPGSTFKLVTGVAGLQHGLVTPSSPYHDVGYIEVGGQRFRNDSGDGALGYLEMPQALTQSSNVYFFDIGRRLWEGRGTYGDEALQNTAAQFGFGQMTGIDLPDEKAVPVPTPERLRKLVEKYPDDYSDPNWYTGTSLNLAIGQGDLLVTPLQLANAYGQFANGGDRYRPTLLLRVLRPFAQLNELGVPVDPADVVEQPRPEHVGHVDLPADWHAAMLQGFTGVTQSTSPRGTASDVFAGFPFDRFSVAGKTGTAQTGHDASGQEKFSNAFFVGFGPTGATRYVGVSILEQAGYGSAAAAPVVRAMLEPLATTGAWPTVEPAVPSSPPPPTTSTTTTPSTTTTLPGEATAENGAASPEAVGGATGDTSETTTPGAVAAGGR